MRKITVILLLVLSLLICSCSAGGEITNLKKWLPARKDVEDVLSVNYYPVVIIEPREETKTAILDLIYDADFSKFEPITPEAAYGVSGSETTFVLRTADGDKIIEFRQYGGEPTYSVNGVSAVPELNEPAQYIVVKPAGMPTTLEESESMKEQYRYFRGPVESFDWLGLVELHDEVNRETDDPNFPCEIVETATGEKTVLLKGSAGDILRQIEQSLFIGRLSGETSRTENKNAAYDYVMQVGDVFYAINSETHDAYKEENGEKEYFKISDGVWYKMKIWLGIFDLG